MNTFSNLTLAIGPFGTTELLLILAVVILLFGAKKLPELAKGLGNSIKEFKKASKEADEEDASKKPADKTDAPKPPGTN